MVIDLKKLRQRGEEQAPFEFVFTPDKELLNIPGWEFAENAKISGLVDVYDDKAYLQGSVEFGIVGQCSRCLKPAEKTVVVDFDEEFRPYPCEDEEVNEYKNDRIDLNTLTAQLILTNVPYTIYCKEDCKGLCPTCGKDLNEGECGCDKN